MLVSLIFLFLSDLRFENKIANVIISASMNLIHTLQARIEKKLDEELPQEWMGGM